MNVLFKMLFKFKCKGSMERISKHVFGNELDRKYIENDVKVVRIKWNRGRSPEA